MEEEYQEVGWIDGYQVFVKYAKEGPDMEEAYALYQEAKNSVLFQSMAAVEREGDVGDIQEEKYPRIKTKGNMQKGRGK